MIKNEKKSRQQKAIIIGAGPAGLTAAYELAKQTRIKPVIFEASADIGGISKTVNYKGYRMDMGGHRFFSKSQKVMDWWQKILPLETAENVKAPSKKTLKMNSSSVPETQTEAFDKFMLLKKRLSRIFYLQRFFDYPLSLNVKTISNLGLVRTLQIGISYLWAQVAPVKTEESLEDFLINRFGRVLYNTFFKDYTIKVWGIEPSEISADWGAQRIKGLSVSKAISHSMVKLIKGRKEGLGQLKTETSLIDKFMYPKYGPGQLWEEVALKIVEMGGDIHLNQEVTELYCAGNLVQSVLSTDKASGKTYKHDADFVISTMPVKDLINSMGSIVPSETKRISNGLIYRDFMTAGILVKNLSLQTNGSVYKSIPDLWVYIQENDVKLGRLQVFNNWSEHLLQKGDKQNIWLGLEYFCNEGDELWNMNDDDFIHFAISELEKINVIKSEDVLDGTVIRVPKAYPAYFGSYDRFNEVKEYLDRFKNLFLIGRNGMHRYNNMDHSMLTAMEAVKNIRFNLIGKNNIWKINSQNEYHEEKAYEAN